MTAQELLDELLSLQKRGFDLDELNVYVVNTSTSTLNETSDIYVTGVEVDGPELVLY